MSTSSSCSESSASEKLFVPCERQLHKSLRFYAATSFLSAVLTEIFLEKALRRSQGHQNGAGIAMVLTCGEFSGCCIFAFFCGGEFLERRSTDLDRKFSNLIRHWAPYLGLSLLLICGSGLSNIAVNYVQFPTKVIVKSCKLAFTMILAGAVGNSQSFTSTEYLRAAAICAATAVFSFGSGDDNASDAFIGILMLITGVLADITAVNGQQWMMQRWNVNPMSLMLRQNLVGLIISLTCLISSGSVTSLAVHDSKVWVCAAAVGFFMALTVWANLHIIKEAGSVVQVRISTIRRAATVLFSYVLFPKPLSPIRALAALLVITLTGSKVYEEKKSSARMSPMTNDEDKTLLGKRTTKVIAVKVPAEV